MHVLQFIMSHEDIDIKDLANVDVEEPEPEEPQEDDGRLSTIEEGTQED